METEKEKLVAIKKNVELQSYLRDQMIQQRKEKEQERRFHLEDGTKAMRINNQRKQMEDFRRKQHKSYIADIKQDNKQQHK